MDWVVVIGLEVHVQLNIETKAFCSCKTEYGAEVNTQICPVCLGYPGALPVLNSKLVDFAILAGHATSSKIREISTFARKNYFYPDLPKGYQISQYDDPICYEGFIEIDTKNGKKKIGLTRIHMEEDSGKSMHEGNASLIDLNRSGIALLEIVSEPDMRSSSEAYAYLTTLKQRLKYAGISNCNMEEGSLRCDANISLMPKGSTTLGTRTELKNLNSFRNVEKALEHEIKRQKSVLESGEKVIQDTLLWDEGKQETRSMRSKEESHDYRYFPEPDLVPVKVTEEHKQQILDTMVEMPDARKARFVSQFGISEEDALVLTQEKEIADYFEKVTSKFSNTKLANNWVRGEILRIQKEHNKDFSDIIISADNLIELLGFLENGDITAQTAKAVLDDMAKSGESAGKIIEQKGLKQISGSGELESMIDAILEKNPAQVQKYREGKTQLLGFFIGQVMKASQGRADQKLSREILLKKLG